MTLSGPSAWRIYWSRAELVDEPRGHEVQPEPRLIRIGCETTGSEREARHRAMDHYQRGDERVAVRPPYRREPIAGPALEAWLAESLSGPV